MTISLIVHFTICCPYNLEFSHYAQITQVLFRLISLKENWTGILQMLIATVVNIQTFRMLHTGMFKNAVDILAFSYASFTL